jgi:hypothetical protein
MSRYQHHRPEATLLYQLVERYYPAFVAALAERGRQLPVDVEEEFAAYLKCGRLEHGSRDRATGAPWAVVSSVSRTARIPPAGRHFLRRNRLLHHWAKVTAGRRLRAGRLLCRQPGALTVLSTPGSGR